MPKALEKPDQSSRNVCTEGSGVVRPPVELTGEAPSAPLRAFKLTLLAGTRYRLAVAKNYVSPGLVMNYLLRHAEVLPGVGDV